MKRFISIILSPTQFFSDHGVIDLDKQVMVCRCTCEREADRICRALQEFEERRTLSPKALLGEAKS